jgi:hypothetical protein
MQAKAEQIYTSRAEALLAGVILTAFSTALLIIWIGSMDAIVDMAGIDTGKKERQVCQLGW